MQNAKYYIIIKIQKGGDKKMSDITNINKKIGERIREKRIEKGLTLKQLGDLVGVDSSTILRYEKGEIKKIKSIIIILWAAGPGWFSGLVSIR